MKIFNYLLAINLISILMIAFLIYNNGFSENLEFYFVISTLLIHSYLFINFNSKEIKNWISLKNECEIIEKKIKMKKLEKELNK